MDFFMNGQAHGSTAQKLLASGMNPAVLRPWVNAETGKCYFNNKGKAVQVENATLRKDEWKYYDDALVTTKQHRLGAVQDLESRGLVFNLTNGMGTTVMEYETETDVEDAIISMDGLTRAGADRPEYDLSYLPLPIAHRDFHLNARVLAASRSTGQPLNTRMVTLNTRKVMEKTEAILMNGASSFTFGGGTLYGYLDAPNRNTVTLSTQWTASAATGAVIRDDVLAMKQASIDAYHFGPWVLYVPTGYETKLDEDYSSSKGTNTIRERLLQIDGIEAVNVNDTLTAHNVVLVQMTPDVVQLVRGMPLSVVEWSSDGEMRFNFKVMEIAVPIIYSDAESHCGITHLSA